MLISKSIVSSEQLDLAVEIAASISSLPAVATQDWCDRAAEALRKVRPHAIVSVALVNLGQRGSIVQYEAGGASGNDPFGRALEGEVIHPEHSASFDWWFDESVPASQTGIRVGLLRELPCSDRWLESHTGRRWSKLGVNDLLVATAPMSTTVSGRCFVIEIGVGAGHRPLSETEAGVMRAVIAHLVNRATLAFGSEMSTSLTRLTHREQQVLEHLALGKSVKQIATDLARSPHTVHDHVKSLHRKLNASSRGELIARALGHLASCSRKPTRMAHRIEEYEDGPTIVSKIPALMSA